MKDHTHSYTLNYIITAADECLNSIFLRDQYGKVILPMTLIARLDAVLEDTKHEVLAAAKVTDDWTELCAAARQPFCNKAPLDLKAVGQSNDNKILKARFAEYLNGFSPNVTEILGLFGFGAVIDKISETGVLRVLIDKFTSKWIGLSPNPTYKNSERTEELFPGLDSRQMSGLFMELAGLSDENVIEGQTPNDVTELMVDLVFVPVAGRIEDGEYSVYDGACALGELLVASDDRLRELGKAAKKSVSAHIFGQEANPEFYAICKAAFLLNSENTAANITFGSALSADGNTESRFDFMISCPPHGKSWKADFDKMSVDGRVNDDRFVDRGKQQVNLIPGTRDGQLLYLLNNVSKMKETPLGSRIVEVHGGSLLFSGIAGSAESNARRYLIERDLIEAIIALPKNIFYGSGNSAFIIVLSNRKEERRRGKIQLINASAMKSQLFKSVGRKNCELNENIRREILRIYTDMEESEVSHIVGGDEFCYWAVAVESPLRQRVNVNTDTIKETLSMFKNMYGVDIGHENDGPPEVDAADILSYASTNPTIREIRTPKTWDEVQFEQVYHVYMRILLDMMREEPYMDYDRFLEKFLAHPLYAKNSDRFNDYEDFMYPLLEKDPNAGIVTRGGKPVSDPDLRVVKCIPFTYEGGPDAFLKNEITPHNPYAWINLAATRTGCEINFSKHFFKPKKLRSASVIIEEIRQLENGIVQLGNEHFAKKIYIKAEERRSNAAKRELITLDNAASEQFIKNTGLAERNVLLLNDGKIVKKDIKLSDGELASAYENYQIVFPGNIILRLTEFRGGQTGNRVGLVTEQGIISSSYVCLKVMDNILPEYLYLQLHIADISHAFFELGGGLRRNLSFKDIAKMTVSVIPLADQEAVVETVRGINAPVLSAIEKLNAAAAALKELENSLIAEAIGDL